MSLFGFDIKWIVIAMIVGAVVIAGTFIVGLIRGNALKDSLIENQKVTIETMGTTIDNLEKTDRLKSDIVKKRDLLVEQLEDQLDKITEDLGTGEDDQAADSLKEIMRRLK